MATEFHLFSQLPYELRAMIWSFAAHPRSITVILLDGCRGPSPSQIALPAPRAPAVMHTCREARRHASYQKAFCMPSIDFGTRFARYIWVNFEFDMICIRGLDTTKLNRHYADIRRLKVECLHTSEMIRHEVGDEDSDGETDEDSAPVEIDILDFPALTELHIALPDLCLARAERYWLSFDFGPCPRENVRFVDSKTGLVLTGDEAYLARQFQYGDGCRVRSMDGIDLELRLISKQGCFLDRLSYTYQMMKRQSNEDEEDMEDDDDEDDEGDEDDEEDEEMDGGA